MEEKAQEKYQRSYKYIDIIMLMYVLVLVLSNIGSSAKIIDWGIRIGSIPLSFDAGTLLFPIGYVIGDVMTEVYGYKRARRIIWIGFGAMVISALVFKLIQVLPGEATWEASVGQGAYNQILGGMSSGAIITASLLGYLAGSFSNAILMSVMKVMTKGKWLWTRTIGSTIVGEAVDTAIFILAATLLGVFPKSLFWSLTITNYIFKVLIEVLVTPLTYGVINTLKRVEDVNAVDEDISLSPFKFR